MKKKLIASLVLFSSFVARLFADSFTDAIQDLAVYTACIGKYNMAQAGESGIASNYYTEEMIDSRLAQESGNQTMTPTFFGLCFNYAQFAYNYIKANSDWYRSQGMRENQYWIAGTDDNPNSIELQYPGDKNNYTVIQNGVYMKRPANNPYRSVKTHRHADGKGKRATHHAWIWIERADGVQFWVDPTWTDNLGYVVYGYVSQSGEEIQCRPDHRYDSPLLKSRPEYLNNLPLPPSYGNTIPPSPTANSTNREETIKDAGRIYTDIITGKTIHATADDLSHIWSIGFHTPRENPFTTSTMGFSVGCESVPVTADTWHSMIFMWQVDYYALDGNSALLFDINLGYNLGWNYFELGLYGGGGIGCAMEDSYFPIGSGASLAWKWTAGIRLMLQKISFRGELSYLNKSDYMIGMYVGLPLANKDSKY